MVGGVDAIHLGCLGRYLPTLDRLTWGCKAAIVVGMYVGMDGWMNVESDGRG